MRFQATLEQNGKTATGIEVPARLLEDLGSGKRPAVRVTINGYTYQTSVGSMGGRSLLPVSAEVRGHTGLAAGDMVAIDLELDGTTREVVVPDDLAEALQGAPGARQAFERLSYSGKRRIVEPIEQAKTPETRRRRIEKSVESLR